jgi:hypothetical protein
MLPLTWSGMQVGRRLLRGAARRALGSVILAAGLVTMAAPWLVGVPVLHDVLVALGCLPAR